MAPPVASGTGAPCGVPKEGKGGRDLDLADQCDYQSDDHSQVGDE